MEAPNDRPLRVTILSAFVLCITSWNLMRVLSALTNWDILREFGAAPAYIMFSGLVWAAAGLWLAYAAWTGLKPAWLGGLVISSLYFTWYWIDRLAIQPSPAPNLVFSAVVSAVLLVYVMISLVSAKAFFEKERG